MATDRLGGGAEPPDSDTAHPRAWLSLAILCLLVIISYIDRMAIVLMVEPIKRDLGITDLEISFLQGLAYALCFALAGPPLAWLADHYSRRQVIYWGVTIWSVATMASGMTMEYSHLLAARFFVGIGEAALMPAAFSLLADLFPKRQHARAFGIVAAGAAVGGAAAISGGSLLVTLANDLGSLSLPVIGTVRPWQLVFLAAGVPGLPAAALVFLIPGGLIRQASPGEQGSNTGLLHWIRTNTGFFILFTLAISLLCALAYGVTNWAPTFFIRAYGLDVAEFAMSLAAIQLVMGVAGYVGGGYLVDRLSQKGVRNPPYLYLGCVALTTMVASIGAFGLLAGPAVSLAFLALFHLALPMTGIVAAELHMAVPRMLRSQVIAVVTAIYTLIGMIVGPSSVAWLTDKFYRNPADLPGSLTIIAAIYCPLIIVLLLASRRAADRAIHATPSERPALAATMPLRHAATVQ